jgi:flagellar assembly factor FliW
MSTSAQRKPDAARLLFEEGIIGVPRARHFELLERRDSPVRMLRCLDLPSFVLPVIDPTEVDPSYGPKIAPRIFESLGLSADDSVLLLAVATLEPDGILVNLRAPLVINPRSCVGAQVILENRKLPLRAPMRSLP